jgi:hypothetical protein
MKSLRNPIGAVGIGLDSIWCQSGNYGINLVSINMGLWYRYDGLLDPLCRANMPDLEPVSRMFDECLCLHIGPNASSPFDPLIPTPLRKSKPMTTPVKRKAAVPAQGGSTIKAARMDVAATADSGCSWMQ